MGLLSLFLPKFPKLFLTTWPVWVKGLYHFPYFQGEINFSNSVRTGPAPLFKGTAPAEEAEKAGMRKADRIVGWILFSLALVCAVEGWRTWDGVGGTGFFPVILAGIFAFLSLGLLLGKTAPEEDHAISWPDKKSWWRMALVFSALISYAILSQWVGYPAATVLFLAALCKIIGERRWPFGFLFGAGVAAVTYVVFKIWLNLPLPAGLWGI